MFEKSGFTCSTKELTKSLAQEIYLAIRKYGNWHDAFTASDTNFDYTNCIAVGSMVDSVQSEIMSRMYSGETDRKKLVAGIESALDVEEVLIDVIAYNGGGYNPKRTWAEFVDSFRVPEGI